MNETLIEYGSYNAFYGAVFYGGTVFSDGVVGTPVVITAAEVENNGQTLLNSITITVTFEGILNSFSIEDIVVSNCTVSNFSGSNLTYTFTMSSADIGRASILIPPGITTNESDVDSEQASFSVYFAEGVTGEIAGALTEDTTLVGYVTLTANLIVPAGITLTIDASAYLEPQDYVIIIQNGGVLLTGNRRLPEKSIIRSVVLIVD